MLPFLIQLYPVSWLYVTPITEELHECISDWQHAARTQDYSIYYADLLHQLFITVKQTHQQILIQVPLQFHDSA